MSGKWLFGIDIGGTTTKIAVITSDGNILQKCILPTPKTDHGSFLALTVQQAIETLLRAHRIAKKDVAGIGVGAPGPVDQGSGVFYELTNLDWPDNFPVKRILEEAVELPVVINNDANCAALGEMWRGAGAGSQDLVCLTLGTGIGGGVIINGNIVQGISGAAGEIGHFPSVITNGTRCNCGKTGCLETVASGTGIARLAVERVKRKHECTKKLKTLLKQKGFITAKDVFELARAGDRTALEVVSEAASFLGMALAQIACIVNPEKMILGGGVAKAGSLLLNPVKSAFAQHAFPVTASKTDILLAQLGNDAGVIGAAWMVKHQELSNIH